LSAVKETEGRTLQHHSVCIVCPHRHGEYSGKDYEAVISRALLVKPLARHLQSYPDIYDVNVTCVEARALAFSAWSLMAITP
jgi:hypothetical protein